MATLADICVNTSEKVMCKVNSNAYSMQIVYTAAVKPFESEVNSGNKQPCSLLSFV